MILYKSLNLSVPLFLHLETGVSSTSSLLELSGGEIEMENVRIESLAHPAYGSTVICISLNRRRVGAAAVWISEAGFTGCFHTVQHDCLSDLDDTVC